MPNLGVHAGFVWRRIGQLVQLNNANRPLSAFNVPVTILDPGPDGVLRNADDGPSLRAPTSVPRRSRCRS
jgi:hypothetical protein